MRRNICKLHRVRHPNIQLCCNIHADARCRCRPVAVFMVRADAQGVTYHGGRSPCTMFHSSFDAGNVDAAIACMRRLAFVFASLPRDSWLAGSGSAWSRYRFEKAQGVGLQMQKVPPESRTPLSLNVPVDPRAFSLFVAGVPLAPCAARRQLCDEMETQMEEGGNVIDFHSCDFFPEHW